MDDLVFPVLNDFIFSLGSPGLILNFQQLSTDYALKHGLWTMKFLIQNPELLPISDEHSESKSMQTLTHILFIYS